MKTITSIFLLFFIYNCGYTTVYNNQKSQDIFISITDTQGDSEINNLIKNQLSIISNSKSLNVFYIDFNSKYEKVIISKNSAGIATDYKLKADFEFSINKNGTNKKIKLSENFNIKNESENFEQTNYERSIKRNFAISVKNRLIPYLINFNDS
tara:strand:- start:514 stop:972 length:459 start_codon:yes stop_codon:yes gene_type:complete